MYISSLSLVNPDYKNYSTPKNKHNCNFKGSLVNDYIKKDEFKKNDSSQDKPTDLNPQKNEPDNSTKISADKKENKWLTKENAIVAGAGLVLSGAIAAYGLMRGRKNQKAMRKIINTAQSEIMENQRVIVGLREQITKLTSLPSDLAKVKETFIEDYQKFIKNAVLGYDPLKVPVKNVIDPKEELKYALRIMNIELIDPLKLEQRVISKVTDSEVLKKALADKGRFEILLPKTSATRPIISENAFIGDKFIKSLGQTVDTDIKLNYGKRISWSEQKIARDIMQNFYDGHGHTLDGVRLAVKKLPNGEYSVKISGEATYDFENLQFLGSGSKAENPFNAGGFGEGTKILVANLLGKGDSKSVKFACADWTLTFDGANGVMRRTLKKAEAPLMGNSIEFNTSNKKLVDAIAESTNYFMHSKNPDLQGLHYDSPDFAFKFIDGKGKGNVYMTQRFEFGKEGAWSGNVDNLTLIFKRKPDSEKYEKMIGRPFVLDRDRMTFSNENIENLTRYFASEMSDEELAQTLITTKSMWAKLPKNKETALSSFLKGIIEVMKDRGLKIDFGSKKLVADSYNVNDVVRETLGRYGYEICPKMFRAAGMSEADTVFKNLSVHTPLTPNSEEIKKLKLLEEGLKVIKDNIDEVLMKHAKNPIFKFSKDYNTNHFYGLYKKLNEIPEIAEISKRYELKYGFLDSASSELFDNYKKDVEAAVIKILNSNNNNKAVNIILNAAADYSKYVDKMSLEYVNTYKTLQLIRNEDLTKPRFIFDRNSEVANDVLGEALINDGKYLGHWVDREYLKNADFNTILATWLHEICHKSGGDGTAEFTYTLTDMLRVLLNAISKTTDQTGRIKLSALEEVYNNLNKPLLNAA